MPCMGPSWDVMLPKKIVEDILVMLKEKHHINNNGFEKNDKLDFDDELKEELLVIISDIVKSDAYNGF